MNTEEFRRCLVEQGLRQQAIDALVAAYSVKSVKKMWRKLGGQPLDDAAAEDIAIMLRTRFWGYAKGRMHAGMTLEDTKAWLKL